MIGIKSKLGRPPTTWPDRLRYRLWYARVREVYPWPAFKDHWLDRRFAGNDVRPSVNAPKTFSRVAKGACLDLTADGPAQVDVVGRVAAEIEGSAELLESAFWTYLKRPPGVEDISYLLDAFLESHELERISTIEFDSRFGTAGDTPRSKRIASVRLALRKLSMPLERLTFLLLLEREADFGGETTAVEVFRSYFDEHLEYFLDRHAVSLDYYLEILDAAFYQRKAVEPAQRHSRLRAESSSSRLVVPQRLAEEDEKRERNR